MGLLDDYSRGVGRPRPKWRHQRVMDFLHHYSFEELNEQGLFMITEATVTDNWDDLAPDLVIFDERYHPLTIIEITTHKEVKKIINKCYELIERFPHAEYFVYDYEKDILYMYDFAADRWLSSEEYELYSKYLNNPLRTYLENTP